MSIMRVLVASLLVATALPSVASTTSLAADGQWTSFKVSDLESLAGGTEWIDDVDSLSPDAGSTRLYSFVVPEGYVALLDVVDAGYYGDTFGVFDGASAIGATSGVPLASYESQSGGAGVVDFDAAFADARYSRGSFQLGAGSHLIGGNLLQSVTVLDFNAQATALNSTLGAVRLTISPVPEPAAWLTLLAGAGVLGAALRRQRR